MAEENQSEIAAASPPPPTSGKTKKLKGLNVNKLGVFLDGWADLVEDRGDKADEVKQLVYKYLSQRNMPDVEVNQVNGSVGIGTKKRPYNISTTNPSATTAIYVGKHGQDMYVSWRTFIKPQLSAMIGIIALVSFVVGVIPAARLYTIRIENMFFSASGQDFGSLALTTFFIFTIFTFILLSFLVAVLGIAIKGDFSAYFLTEPNIFDAEDITAMGLSAHKSLLRGMDNTGIDVTQLRLKQNFKGGRTGETV